jgi:hypothetical protein
MLVEIGRKFDCELFMPPAKDINVPFFIIDELRFDDQISFMHFLIELTNVVGSYQVVGIEDKICLKLND